MYVPAQFSPKDDSHALALMRQFPFASLISNDDEGFPFVTHLPLHVSECDGHILLLGHCARPNPHWRYLQARPQALVTFMGPQAYMSPTVYPDLAHVPTWSYLAVHAQVTASLIDGEQNKDRLLKALIGDHEPTYVEQWRSLSEDYQRQMLQGIAAFELSVTHLQCKLKLNQHRPEALAGMYASYSQGTANEQALAEWMRTLGLAQP